MEKALEQISTAGVQCFPATIGSKPTLNGVFKGKENTTPRCMPTVSFEQPYHIKSVLKLQSQL